MIYTRHVQGIVIARRNRSVRSTFTLRALMGPLGGIERTFPLYSPHLLEIKVLRLDWRHAYMVAAAATQGCQGLAGLDLLQWCPSYRLRCLRPTLARGVLPAGSGAEVATEGQAVLPAQPPGQGAPR